MKKSQRVSLTASLLYVVTALILLSLVKPLLHVMVGPIPVMVYVLIAASFACPIVTYFLVPYVEKLEEKEHVEEDKTNGKGV